MHKNSLTFIDCDTDYAQADMVLFGVPFDGTASFRPGSRFAPNAIRQDSYGLETYSPYADRDLADYKICDIGDLDLPFGNPDSVLAMTEDTVTAILADQKLPVMLGGEHLVTLGAIRAMLKTYPDLHIIHLDAHTDLRDEYMGETLSHASVIRRVWDLVGDGRIHQFGIRSGEKEEFQFADAHTDIHRFSLSGFAETLETLKGKPVYFTLDLDILDPAYFPGTGTPEPGGVSFSDVLSAVLKLHKINLVGCDIVELAPHYDTSGVSTAVSCKLVREILLQLKGA